MAKRGDGDLPEDHERLGATTLRLMMAFPNWSNQKLAEETDYDPKLIGLWVAGRRDPKPEQLEEVASAIGVSLEWFENFARSAIRFRRVRRDPKGTLEFAGSAEDIGRKVTTLIAAAFPEIEALIEADAAGAGPREIVTGGGPRGG